MSMVRPTWAGSSTWPASSRPTSSSNRRPTRSASGPVTLISLPRTWMSTPPKACSIRRSSSSRCPRSPTMRWLPGTRILTAVDTGDVSVSACSSAGRPAHGPPADDVQVEVGDGVAALLAHVEHEPVAPLGQPLLRGHGVGGGEDAAQQLGVPGLEDAGVLHVLEGDDEHVGGACGFRS